MKKALLLLLVAICCVSVFAADVSAKLAVHMTFDNVDGYSYKLNENWETMIGLSAAGNNAGASMNFVPKNFFEGMFFSCELWAKPVDNLKIALGSSSEVSFTNGFNFKSDTEYGTVTLENENSLFSVGFGYRPQEDALFAAGVANVGINGFGVFHLDGLTKFDVDNRKLSLNYALAELTYSHGLNSTSGSDYNPVVGAVYNKESLSSKFDDENRFFSWVSEDNYHQNYGGIYAFSRLSAGLRFKHYTDDETYNGLYGYAFLNLSLPENNFAINAEIEAGAKAADTAIRGTFQKEALKAVADVMAGFDWADGDFAVKFDEACGWASYQADATNYKLSIDYFNKDSYSSRDNGIFVTPEVSTNIDMDALNFKARLGMDSDKNFCWRLNLNNTVGF